MKLYVAFLCALLGLASCTNNKTGKVIEDEFVSPEEVAKIDEDRYRSYFLMDSTLSKSDSVFSVNLSDGTRHTPLASLCLCEKDKANNAITVQVVSAIPTMEELKAGNTDRSRVLMNLGSQGSFKGQKKILTMRMKDRTLEEVTLFSKSTNLDYEGKDYQSIDIDRYQVTVSQFNYTVAKEVYGKYEVILPRDFGFFKNDTIVTGYFQCTHAGVYDLESLKILDMNERNKEIRENSGFRVGN